MPSANLDIYDLGKVCHLSHTRCSDFSEAAAVCLDYHGHVPGKFITIEGDLGGQFELTWEEVTQQMRDTRNDMDYTVESGAYCMAMLIIERLTELKVVKQSQKRTGFDCWLGTDDDLGMQDHARLEVSGILKGNKGKINQRLKEKVEQTKKSDNLNIPAYIVIVEFSQPVIKIKKR